MGKFTEALKKREEEKEKTSQSGGKFTEALARRKAEQAYEQIASGYNTILEDYKALADSHSSRFGNGYQSDVADWYSQVSNRANEVGTEIEGIKALLDQYESYYDADWVANSREGLDYFLAGYGDLASKADTAQKYWAQWADEDAYNKDAADWLEEGAQINRDYIAARQKIYDSNAERIAELEDGYVRTGVDIVDDTINGIIDTWNTHIKGKAPRDEADKKEAEKLRAENLQYMRGQAQLDKYFKPITQEFLQNAKYRDYNNPTVQDIEAYAMSVGDTAALIASGAELTSKGWVDKDGNVILQNRAINNPAPIVKDKLGFYLDNRNNTESVHSDYASTFMGEAMTEGRSGSWEFLKEDEKDIYYDLLKSEGPQSAYEFLDAMKPTLNKRATMAMAEGIADASALEQVFYNVASIPANVLGGAGSFIDDALHMIRGEDINPYSYGHRWQNFAQAVRQDTAEDINRATGNVALPYVGTTFGDVYQALMSGADSLVGLGLGGSAYGILMGMGAASSEARELYEKGASIGQIAAGGILAGAAEMVFEKFSIDHFVNMGDAKTIKTIVVNALKQGGVEASEEAFTEIANTLTDAIVMGTQSDWQGYVDKYVAEGATGAQAVVKALFKDVAPNVINSAIGGFISGGGMGSLGSTAQYVGSKIQEGAQTKAHGQSIIDAGGVDTLMALANDMNGVKDVSRAAKKVVSKASAKNVGKLSVKMDGAVNSQNAADVQKALVDKGLSEKKAKRIAENITGNKTLTLEERVEIMGNEKVAEVVNELVNDPTSALNQRKTDILAARLGVDIKNTKIDGEKTKVNEVSLKNEVDVKDKVSDKGKTVKTSTGEAITIDKNNAIAKTKMVDGERVVYYNTDHGVVELSDVTYASEEEGLLYEAFSDMNPAFANAAIKNYDGAVPVQTYIDGMREGMVLYGMHNFQAVGKDISRNSNLAELSEADQAFALKLGRAYANANAKNADYNLKTAIKNAAQKAEAEGRASDTTPKKGKVRFDSGVAGGKLNRSQRRAVSLAKYLAEAIGIDIVFYDAKTTTDESGKGANGYFNAHDNSIHLDLQNAVSDSKTIAFTLSHELVHFIKKWSPAKYNTFANFLMEQYAEHGVSTSTLLANKMAALNTTDADYAYEEMICDACERMLLDSNAAVKLAELRKTDLDLFEKIKLRLLDLLNKIRDAFKGVDPNTEEGIALQKMEDVLGKLHEMFEDAAVDAAKTYQEAQANAAEIVFGESKVSEENYDTSVKSQLKDGAKIGNASIAYNEKHRNVNAAVLKVGVDTMIEMAETMMPYLEQEGILPPDIPGKTIFKNGSYGRTGENTTLCVRTLTYEDFKDRVSDELGRPLTVAESLLVSQKIYDIATDPQCIYCYVAADRKAYDEYLGEYHKAMDKYIKAMRNGGDVEALYEEYLDGRKDTAAQQKRWAMWKSIANSGKDYISAKDLSTRANRDKVIEGKGDFATQVKDAQRYAQSASWAKTVYDYRAYKGDILKLSKSLVDTLNSEYGLRMYSFSDYTPAFIVENMQMLIDASARGLKSLAYTKDTAYAKIFAPTGQAINVSCFAKYDSKTGTYVEDSRQGASWAETKQLRDKFHNVGAVMVCTNDAMVEWAMKQDWVDVVIPYHIVKTGTTIANEYAWRNYTAESSDRAGGRTANIYPTEHNNDFATYQKLIEERGITPRFDRFYQRALNGDFTKEQYMKLVNEVRLPASELSAVVPMFDLAEAKKSFGVDEDGNVIEGGFVDKGGYMGGWYRAGVDVNQEVLAVKKDIEDGKSSLDVDYGMNKLLKEKQIDKHGIKKQVKRATDKDYLDAVNRGDMETAQRMVDEAAKAAGYDSPKVFHGTYSFGFTKFDSLMAKDHISIFTTTDEEVAKTYTADDAKSSISERSSVTPEALESASNEEILAYLKSFFGNKFKIASTNNHTNAARTSIGNAHSKLNTFMKVNAKRIDGKKGDILRKMSDSIKTLQGADTYKDFNKAYDEYERSVWDLKWADNELLSEVRPLIVEDLNRAYTMLVTSLSSGDVMYTDGKRMLSRSQAITEIRPKLFSGVYKLYGKLEKPFVIDCNGVNWNDIDGSEIGKDGAVTTWDVATYAKLNGYDGVIFRDLIDKGDFKDGVGESDVYVFFKDNALKSADPITYDDNGEVIPLSERFDSENKDIRYQKKTVTNRTLLANALESATQSDIEKNKLAQYKSKIELIESEQAKLAEVRAKANELRFTKGRTPDETKKMKALDFEANQIANRINTYDRQLLNLESTMALKNVLQREKEQARKRAEQKGKEALEKYKEKAAEKQKELKAHYQESRKKGVEGRRKTEMRGEIRKVVRDLNHLLNHGTKERNVKEGMQEAVASAITLAEVLFSDEISNADIVRLGVASVTPDEKEYLAEYKDALDSLKAIDDQLAGLESVENPNSELFNTHDDLEGARKKLENKISGLNQKLSSVFVRERARLNEGKVADVIGKLVNEYSALENSGDDYIKNAYSESVKKRLEALQKDLGGTLVRDMDIYQLTEVYDAYKMIEHMVRTSNQLFRDGRAEVLSEYVMKTQAEILRYYKAKKDPISNIEDKKNLVSAFAWNNLKPVYAFDRLGSETFEKLYWDAVRADDDFAVLITEAGNFLQEQRAKYGYADWNLSKATEFKLADGKTFKLTLEDMMSIYAYSKREQADKHMTEGGFVFDENNTYSESPFEGKKLLENFRLKKKHAKLTETYLIDDRVLAKIIGFFNKDENADKKAYVDAMQKYMTDMGQKGNEVSRVLYGIDLFTEENYIPLQSSTDYRNSNEQALQKTPTQVSLKNNGTTKPTTPGANNPIVLRAFDELWLEHIDTMSKYCAYVLPIENLTRVFNNVSRSEGESPMATKALISATFGKEAEAYIDQYITDLNGGNSVGGYNSPLMTMFSRFKATRVAASLSVWVQQPFAIIRAMDMIRPDYFVPFLRFQKKSSDADSTWEEIKKYAPIAILKEMGGYDIGSTGTTKDYIGITDYKGFKGKVKGLVKDSDYRKKTFDDLVMIGATKMDELGWGIIWKAVKKEVATEQKLKPGTEEFFKAVRDRFTEVVVRTQVYDSVNSRSGLMRSKSDLNKFATSFAGEPTTTINMLDNAALKVTRAFKYGNAKEKAKAIAKLTRTVGVVTASIVFTSLAKSSVYANRDDDDDESWTERWMRNFGESLTNDLNPLSMIPYVRDLVSVYEGWDVERPDMTLAADVITSAKRAIVDGATKEEIFDLIGDFSDMLGIPAKNVIRDVKGIYNLISDHFDNITTTDAWGAFERGWNNDMQTKTESLYSAKLNGDEGRLELYRSQYKTDDAFKTALKTSLRENDPRISEAVRYWFSGDINARVALIQEIEGEGIFDSEIVRGAINSEINRVNNKASEAAQAERKGDTESYSKIVKGLLETYPKDMIEKLVGKSVSDIQIEEAKPNVEKVSSVYRSEDINTALESGDIAFAKDIISELVRVNTENYLAKARAEAEHEGEEFDEKKATEKAESDAKSSVRSSITSYWKPLYKEAHTSGNTTEMLRIRDLLFDSGLYGNTRIAVKKTMDGWVEKK